LAYAAHREHTVSVGTTPGIAVEHATLHVEGMDCEACAVHIRGALAKVGGFHDMTLDLNGQAITVAYEPAPGRLQAYVAAINDLGYEAALPPLATANTN
jgi:copper chaperone CopZ